MADQAEARTLLDQALAEWSAGRHYEAHELLEDVAEATDDVGFDVAMALVHVAAAFHKVRHDVGPQAAPGKIATALPRLRAAPDAWMGLDVASFVQDLEGVLADLEAGRAVTAFPVPNRRRA